MFNLTDYLLSKGISADIVSRIVSKIQVTITSEDDFKNYRARQLGLPPPLIEIMGSVGIETND
jgi:hypothetical protein